MLKILFVTTIAALAYVTVSPFVFAMVETLDRVNSVLSGAL